MRKVTSKIIICLILFTLFWGGLGVGVEKVKAETMTPEQIMWLQKNYPKFDPSDPNSPYTQEMSDAYNAYLATNSTSVNAPTANATSTKPKASWYDWLIQGLTSLLDGPLRWTLGVIAGIYQLLVIPILGAFVKIAAACLDLATQFTLNSANISSVNGAITKTWIIVRDIFNITFIFILLYAAIRTIIGSASANTKKIIADVIIAALLINFSLFITRIVIDAGNILAVSFYNLATLNGSMSMSVVIADVLGLGSIFGSTGITCTFCTEFFLVTAIQSITMLIAIVVLFYITFLFLIRNVVLIFLMAISPVGFMGKILPKIEEYSKMWWETLYGQVFIAPIFLLLFYLIIEIGTKLSLNEINTNSGTTGPPTEVELAVSNSSAAFNQYFKYILIIILLIVAVKITKKMSGAVGKVVEKFGAAAAGIALGAATGGAALLARQTIGRGAASLAANEGLANAAKQGGVKGFGARLALRGATTTAKTSFDARNTDAFKSATGFMGDQTGIKVDYNRGMKIQKDGYTGMVERQEKKAIETAKMINKADVSVSENTVYNKDGTVKEKGISDVRRELEADKQRRLDAKKAELSNLGNPQNDKDREKLEKLQKEKEAIEQEQIKSDADIRKEMEAAKKAARLKTYSDSEESSVLNKFFRNKRDTKSTADKIRKAGDPKDFKTLAAEALKQKEKEEQTTTTNTPPATPTPPPPPATP